MAGNNPGQPPLASGQRPATRSRNTVSTVGDPIPQTTSEEFERVVQNAERQSRDQGESTPRRVVTASDTEAKADSSIAYISDVKSLIDRRITGFRTNVINALGSEIRRLEAADKEMDLRLQKLMEEVQDILPVLPLLQELEGTTGLAAQVRNLRTDVNSLLERPPDGTPAPGPGNLDDRFSRMHDRLSNLEQTNIRLEARLAALGELLDERPPAVPRPGPGDGIPDPPLGVGPPFGKPPRSLGGRSRRSRSPDGSRRRRWFDDDSDDLDRRSRRSIDVHSVPSGSDSEEDRRDERGGIFAREKGPKRVGLRELRPTNRDFEVLLNYRYYRLRVGHPRDRRRDPDAVRDCLSRLKTTSPDLGFDGKDGILVLDFLATFVSDAETLGYTEEQAFLVLPFLLSGFAKDQYSSARGVSRRDGGIQAWPDAVQFLLRSFATNEAIQSALSSLKDIRQREGEDELDYSTRLNRAERRCGNPHYPRDRITHFVNGLDPAVMPRIHSYREDNPRCSYLDVVYKARSEGEARRALFKKRRETPPASPVRKGTPAARSPSRAPALYAEEPLRMQPPTYGDGNLMYMGETDLQSQDTSGLPYDLQYDPQYDPVLLTESHRNSRHVPNSHVPYSQYDTTLARARPGWKDPGAVARDGKTSAVGAAPSSPTYKGLIYHVCYVRRHIVQSCLLSFKDFMKIIWNYERLSAEEKARVPATSYWRAKSLAVESGRQVAGRQAPVQGNVQAATRPASPEPQVRSPSPQPSAEAPPSPKPQASGN